MSRFIPAACLALALALLLTACGPADPPAATVNGRQIPLSEIRVDTRLAGANPQVARLLDVDDSGQVHADLTARVVTQRIEDAAIAQGAQTLDVTVTQADVDHQRRLLIRRGGGSAAVTARLRDVRVGEVALRRVSRSLATAAAVEEALARAIDVTDADLRAFHDREYGTATVRHIVVATAGRARRLVRRLRAGADFATLAAAHSLDEDTRHTGGRLGALDRAAAGSQGSTFADAVFDDDTIGVLDPVPSGQGWHVIEVLARDVGPPLGAVEDEVRARIRAERVGERYADWVGGRIDDADITVAPSIGAWDPASRTVEAVDVHDRA